MLSCLVGKNYVNTVDYLKEELKKWSKKGILKCPVCEGKLYYRHGEIRIPHFSHEKDSECIYTFYENETKEHAIGKVILYKWLKSIKEINNVQLELYIKETKQITDIYFEYKDKKYAIEYQCTPILKSEYNTRHELYKLNNIIDIWIFGLENYDKEKFINKMNESSNRRLKECEIFISNKDNLKYYIDSFNENLYIINKFNFTSKYIVDHKNYIDSIYDCWFSDGILLNKSFEKFLENNTINYESNVDEEILNNLILANNLTNKNIYIYDSYKKLYSDIGMLNYCNFDFYYAKYNEEIFDIHKIVLCVIKIAPYIDNDLYIYFNQIKIAHEWFHKKELDIIRKYFKPNKLICRR